MMYSTLVVLLVLGSAASHFSTQGKYKTNCFSDVDDGKCESSWVKICGDYYACDMAIPFEAPIKRIGYLDNHIFVAEGTHTYLINEDTHETKYVKKVIPPWSESIDLKGNKFYPGDGTTYVSLNETGQEIEIVTTGQHSSNQLALDVNANKLFILTFSQGDKKDLRAGNLFAITVDPLNIHHHQIQAEEVKADEGITAMSVQGGLEKLLLGTRSKKGSKLIRLNRLKEDPCSRKEIQKAAIYNVLSDAREQLVKFVEETDSLGSKSISVRSAHDPHSLEVENAHLKEELNVTNAKISAFTSRLLTFNKNINARNDAENTGTKVDIEHGHHEVSEEKECLPASEIVHLKKKLEHYAESNKALRHQVEEYLSALEIIVKDPLITHYAAVSGADGHGL